MAVFKISQGPNALPVYLYVLVFFIYVAFKCAAATENLYGFK